MKEPGFWNSLLRKVWRSKANGVEIKTEPDGTKLWYRHDRLHRDDGPAVERPDGRKEYWLNGYRWEEDFFLRRSADYKREEALFFRQHAEKVRAEKSKPPGPE
jgi:hypothetical protein